MNDESPEYYAARIARADRWVPACSGTETPFRTRTGATLLYCWNPALGAHAYLDCGSDLILTDDEARARLAH